MVAISNPISLGMNPIEEVTKLEIRHVATIPPHNLLPCALAQIGNLQELVLGASQISRSNRRSDLIKKASQGRFVPSYGLADGDSFVVG